MEGKKELGSFIETKYLEIQHEREASLMRIIQRYDQREVWLRGLTPLQPHVEGELSLLPGSWSLRGWDVSNVSPVPLLFISNCSAPADAVPRRRALFMPCTGILGA